MIVEYLDGVRLRAGLALREQATSVIVADANGHERAVSRELVLVRHPDCRATRETLAAVLGALDQERARLKSELDLNLLWEVVREHGRGYSAEELAELFFGRPSAIGAAVMLEALLADRLFFVRRHLEFVARSAEQVDRLRVQYDKIRLRSESGRRTRSLIREILEGGTLPSAEAAPLVAELTNYLQNPFTRSRELTATLADAVADITPAEAAYEILERLGAPPPGARFVLIGGIRTGFNEAALAEAQAVTAPARADAEDACAITIDDEETVEVDDALSCEMLEDGTVRVRIHIALVADFVAKGGPMDLEAAQRSATVYLPEATIRMLPERISTDAASLMATHDRPVLTTEVRLSAAGELIGYSIYPCRLRVAARLSYDEADQLLSASDDGADDWRIAVLRGLNDAAAKLRDRRRLAGAILVQRHEPKIRVADGKIDLKIIDNGSPSRQLVAEFMVLSNFVMARFTSERRIPMVYRVQAGATAEFSGQRPHLSLHPEFHAGVGLDCYVQASSPIRRYMDLVLQRQLLGALAEQVSPAYSAEELLSVLADAEIAEAEGRELERKAKRYWLLRYLQAHPADATLEATVLRDGASAELDAYAVRGALRGAPNLASRRRILVRISRVDPLRGWLTLDYAGSIV
jgi:exoribonuclease II